MSTVVLLYSGGLDSTVLLYDLLAQGHTVTALCAYYGQHHRKEVECARSITADLGVPFEVTILDRRLFAGSSLTDDSSSVVVPNRNAVLISLAGALAVRDGADAVAIACHGGDFNALRLDRMLRNVDAKRPLPIFERFESVSK